MQNETLSQSTNPGARFIIKRALGDALKALFILSLSGGVFLFIHVQARSIGAGSIGFAIFVNFLLMTLFAVFVGVLKPDLSISYFEAKRFEKGGRVYRRFGLRYFLLLLRLVGSERMRRTSAPLTKRGESLARFEHQTRVSEASHALAAVVVAAITVYVASAYGIGSVIWLVVFNIVLNVYPVMMQRYNRPRVQNVLRQAGR
ncbi:MAG: hypothetical protein AAGI08_17905 [Bacteroidota bacterium]